LDFLLRAAQLAGHYLGKGRGSRSLAGSHALLSAGLQPVISMVVFSTLTLSADLTG
jgi:hypothetical protein